MSFDPYQVLEVARDASEDAIRRAFRRAAAEAHPDREGGSNERMTDVNMAYRILSDPELRANFDTTGALQADSVEVNARDLIIGMVKSVIRNSDPSVDLIAVLRGGVAKQREGLLEARRQTTHELTDVRLRLLRLKGPMGNFIECVFLQEIERGEALLAKYEQDERMQEKALEMLKDYSYAVPVKLPGLWNQTSVTPGILWP